MRICRIDGRQRTKAAVLRKLARDLGGGTSIRNLDALYDVLRRDVPGPVEIVWRPSPALGAEGPRIAAVLREVAAERADVTLRDGA
jgi:RNAse (barnase) inhibitor barstar